AACASGAPAPGDRAGTGPPSAREGRFQPSGAFGAFLAGRFAASETDTAAAARFFAAALAADPTSPELLQRSFVSALSDGRDAAPLARRLLERQPAALLPNLTVMADEARAGRFDAAETRVRALSRDGAGQLLHPLLLAWALAGRGQPEAALATLRPVADGPRFRGIFALHAGLLSELAGRPREAERWYRSAEAEGPLSPRVAEILATVALREGRSEDAARLLASAVPDDLSFAAAQLSQAPGRRPVADAAEGMAEALFALGAALRQQESSEFALLLLRIALILRPEFPPAQILIADILDGDRRHEAAAEILMRVDRASPHATAARLRLATVFDRMDRTAGALAELEALAAADPTRPEPHARKGDILRGRGRFAEAAAAYDAAIERLGPPDRRQWTMFYARGIAHERAKDWPRAEADFLRALELSPDQPYVLNYLGYSWVEQGRELARAKRMIERAVELRPHDGNIVDSLGWVLFRLGDYRGAVRWLERAVELLPRDPVINDHLGDAYWAVGRRTEAQFQWRRALTLGPEPEEIPRIEAKLRDGLALPPAAVAAGATTTVPR
ncbi:MAG: tetratricopeptide repeat protein, partial [Acetobacteraceae bacterium]